MAVGLFGQGKYLYLLGRRFNGETTEWSLSQIDPKDPDSRHIRQVRLPTAAHHLSVVPGRDYWYFFERGEVKGSTGRRMSVIGMAFGRETPRDRGGR